MSGTMGAIDWAAPWLAPWRAMGEPIAGGILAGQDPAAALNRAGTAPVHFVPQIDLPGGMAYEQFVFERGAVPTRDGLHDFFNGLCWMLFPETKRRLNALQAAEIAAAGVSR